MNARKTRIIASREYSAAVRSKSFIITLVLLPIMMSGGLIAQKVGQKIGDTSTYHVAVMDCSPGASLYGAIAAAVLGLDAIAWLLETAVAGSHRAT